ncbi:MAG: hypothetical protein B7Z57_04845 [Acidiphilium sp. 37-60-79]|nr:MAG: hypothetical protein B7Z57_04845 [Acidiphilium sp. 37-60-79]
MTRVNNLSGQQRAELNLSTFLSWAASKTAADFREMVTRGQLNRTEIATETGFAKSVLTQNPRVRECLQQLENRLRAEGVLPPFVDRSAVIEPASVVSTDATNPRAAADKARLKRLEAENAALKAELISLRAQLQRYAAMEAVLASSGRLPR